MCDESHITSLGARVAFQEALYNLLHVIEAENTEADSFDRGVYFFEAVWSEFSATLSEVHKLFDAVEPQDRRPVKIDC